MRTINKPSLTISRLVNNHTLTIVATFKCPANDPRYFQLNSSTRKAFLRQGSTRLAIVTYFILQNSNSTISRVHKYLLKSMFEISEFKGTKTFAYSSQT